MWSAISCRTGSSALSPEWATTVAIGQRRRIRCTDYAAPITPRRCAISPLRPAAGQNNACSTASRSAADWIGRSRRNFSARRIRIRPVRSDRRHHRFPSPPAASAPASSSDKASANLVAAAGARTRRLDATVSDFLISDRGTPLPNEGRLSGRIDHDDRDACRAADCAAFFVRPLRQAPRLDPASPHRRPHSDARTARSRAKRSSSAPSI